MNINQKLFDIQQKLKAPKDQFNAFGKYKYRSCESVLEALKPLLKENNVILILTDEVDFVGSHAYVAARATIIDVEDGSSVSTRAYAREEETKKGMDASQITGAASSYARKYALNGLFAIDDNKDSDATNTGEDKKDQDVVFCADCKQEIKNPKNKDGEPMDLKDYVAMCMKVYERPICDTCRRKHGKAS